MADAQDQPVVEDGAQGQADEVGRRDDTDGGGRLTGSAQAQGGQGRHEAVAQGNDEQPEQGRQRHGQQTRRHTNLKLEWRLGAPFRTRTPNRPNEGRKAARVCLGWMRPGQDSTAGRTKSWAGRGRLSLFHMDGHVVRHGLCRCCRLPPFKATGEKEARFYGLRGVCPRGCRVRQDAAGRNTSALCLEPTLCGAALQPNRWQASSHPDSVIPSILLSLWEPACRR
ncbi:hypothetical protein D3C79_796890 [compost metagenome]